MDFVGQLWQPILVATAFCFIASSIVWMVGPHHKKEYTPPPNEDALRAALGSVGPGAYMFPFGDRENKAAFEDAMKKFAEGPAGIVYVYPRGKMNMGKMMGQQLAFFLFVNFMLAYVGHHAGLGAAPYLRVFQIIGAVAFLTYSVGSIPESIWFARPWKSWALGAFDGLIYALVSAGVFGWLWPR